jgi:hypothetical protein
MNLVTNEAFIQQQLDQAFSEIRKTSGLPPQDNQIPAAQADPREIRPEVNQPSPYVDGSKQIPDNFVNGSVIKPDETPAAEAGAAAAEPLPDQAPMGAEAQHKWDQLKAAAKEAESLKQQLNTFEGTRAELQQLKAEYEAAKAERAGIEGELYRTRVTASKMFKDQVTTPFNILEQVTTDLAKENEIATDELFGAIVRGDKKAMKELVSGLDDYDRTKVYRVYDDMRNLVNIRDNMIADSKSAYQADVAAQQEAQKRYYGQIYQERQQSINQIVPALQEKVSSLLPEAKRKDLAAMANEIADFDSWKEPIKMYSGYASIVLPDVIDSLKEAQTELATAKAEINRLRGGAPKVSQGVTPVASPNVVTPKEDYSKMTVEQLAKQGTNRILQSLGLPPGKF